MTNGVMPPKYGEPVLLICLKCHKRFMGPNPNGLKTFDDLFKKIKRAKCPECGSARVVRDPWVLY